MYVKNNKLMSSIHRIKLEQDTRILILYTVFRFTNT